MLQDAVRGEAAKKAAANALVLSTIYPCYAWRASALIADSSSSANAFASGTGSRPCGKIAAYRDASGSLTGRTATAALAKALAVQPETSVMPTPAAARPQAIVEFDVSTMTCGATPSFENASSIS